MLGPQSLTWLYGRLVWQYIEYTNLCIYKKVSTLFFYYMDSYVSSTCECIYGTAHIQKSTKRAFSLYLQYKFAYFDVDSINILLIIHFYDFRVEQYNPFPIHKSINSKKCWLGSKYKDLRVSFCKVGSWCILNNFSI